MVIWLVTIWETQALLSLRQQPGQTRRLSRPRTTGSSGVGARHKVLLYCSLGHLQILIPRAFMIRDGVGVCTSRFRYSGTCMHLVRALGRRLDSCSKAIK